MSDGAARGSMFEKIIVAFDGTDTGLDGLVLSMGLGKAFGSQVAVVYVYDQELSASSKDAARELAQHAEAVLDGARERVSQGLAVSFCALPAGSPAQGVHELARSEQADLIVLGSRRLGPRTRDALGAVSENVLRAAPCAVAVAPRGYRSDGGLVPQMIGVGWISTAEGEHALRVACWVASATGGSVTLVTATSAPGEVEQLRGRARGAADAVVSALGVQVPVAVHAQVAEPTEALIEHSRALDLIVLGTRGYGPPRTMLFGSVSSRVTVEARCPTMVLAASASRRETS
jgi:nucleotide-binding universal stress UspA family protein